MCKLVVRGCYKAPNCGIRFWLCGHDTEQWVATAAQDITSGQRQILKDMYDYATVLPLSFILEWAHQVAASSLQSHSIGGRSHHLVTSCFVHQISSTILLTLSSSTLLSRPSFLCPFGPPVRAFAIALRKRCLSSIFCCRSLSAASRA